MNGIVLIGLGAVVVAVIIFLILRKKDKDTTTTDGGTGAGANTSTVKTQVKFKQNNPTYIATAMSSNPSCSGRNVSADTNGKNSQEVDCAINVSTLETSFARTGDGKKLFNGIETGSTASDMLQLKYCCCSNDTNPTTDLENKKYRSYC